MMEPKKKTFDCVEMKRNGSLRIHEALKGMSVEEQIEYWKERDELFRQKVEEQKAARAS